MDTSAGQAMVSNAIGALAANGATQTNLGLDMAQRILSANPVQPNETRYRVVIVFTDGAPTSFDGFEKAAANDAITHAGAIKTAGATVYTIGIFPGANAASAGTEPKGDLGQNSSSLNSACNWFMQQVSSNNGAPRTPSYYLSAADTGALTTSSSRSPTTSRAAAPPPPDGGIRGPGYHLPPVHPSCRSHRL